jgi:hypothetical protein
MISGDESDWAREYERSILPHGTIFPRGDEIWGRPQTRATRWMCIYIFAGTSQLRRHSHAHGWASGFAS